MKKILPYNLFESNKGGLGDEDTLELVELVNELLVDLRDEDYTTACVLVSYRDRLKPLDVERYRGAFGTGKPYALPLEMIRIDISKGVSNTGTVATPLYRPAFKWEDIKGLTLPIIERLSEAGWSWRSDLGTLAEGDVPLVSTSGSSYENLKSKCQMFFEPLI